MKISHRIGLLLLACAAISCRFLGYYPHPDTLSGKIETLELTSMLYACDCAQWMPAETIDAYSKQGEEIPETLAIYVEPADTNLLDIEDLEMIGNHFRVTGQFYTEKGYPLGYRSDQGPEPARVFRYEHVEPVFPLEMYDHIPGVDSTIVVSIRDAAALDQWLAKHR